MTWVKMYICLKGEPSVWRRVCSPSPDSGRSDIDETRFAPKLKWWVDSHTKEKVGVNQHYKQVSKCTKEGRQEASDLPEYM